MTMDQVNKMLAAKAREPFGHGSRSFPSYGGSRVERWGKRFVLGTWNHGHSNWIVEDVKGGHGYGPSILAAAGQCSRPRTYTLRELELD